MSAIPQRPVQPSADQPTRKLTDALVRSAAARSQQAAQAARLATARALAAEELRFHWHTEGGSEAELRIYFLPGPEPEVVATELISIDFREPTPQERSRYQEAFEAELDAGGELWARLASYLSEHSRA